MNIRIKCMDSDDMDIWLCLTMVYLQMLGRWCGKCWERINLGVSVLSDEPMLIMWHILWRRNTFSWVWFFRMHKIIGKWGKYQISDSPHKLLSRTIADGCSGTIWDGIQTWLRRVFATFHTTSGKNTRICIYIYTQYTHSSKGKCWCAHDNSIHKVYCTWKQWKAHGIAAKSPAMESGKS